jgi:predicted Fe-Mo cluster-binding NifX family protein
MDEAIEMKVAVPTNDRKGMEGELGEHFGRVPYYTIVDMEDGSVDFIDNTSEHMGGTGMPAEILARAGIQILVCRGLGRRAVAMFDEMGIEVFIGATSTVDNAIKLWKSGALCRATAENACSQHAFGDHHGHDHHH